MKVEVHGDFSGQVVGGDLVSVGTVHIVVEAGLTADEAALLAAHRAAKAREAKKARGLYEEPEATVYKTG